VSARGLDAAGRALADVAMRACVDRLRRRGVDVTRLTDAEIAELLSLLRPALSESLPGALDDGREAAALGMHDVATETVRLSVALAGVRAADEWMARRRDQGLALATA